jgi:hypothetical protein
MGEIGVFLPMVMVCIEQTRTKKRKMSFFAQPPHHAILRTSAHDPFILSRDKKHALALLCFVSHRLSAVFL